MIVIIVVFQMFYYFNSEDKFPKEISIPDCDQPCSLTNFQKTLENIWVEDYEDICKLA
jgi:lysosomal acid phosphatase